eukprot:8885074-Pyramimonas_sp.AAC.1
MAVLCYAQPVAHGAQVVRVDIRIYVPRLLEGTVAVVVERLSASQFVPYDLPCPIFWCGASADAWGTRANEMPLNFLVLCIRVAA